ncbi:MAG: hypothetical protein ACK533_13010, partial [Planctomycetota bacterium]
MAKQKRSAAVALLVAIVGALAVLGLCEPSAPPAAATNAAGNDPASAPRADATLPAPATPTTERVAAPAAPATADDGLAHPHEVGLEVRVVGPLGLPMAGVRLRWPRFPGPPTAAAHATDPDGRVALTLRTRAPQLDVQ